MNRTASTTPRGGGSSIVTPKLTQVIRLDSLPLGQTSFTPEGYLKDRPILTSTGIFEYTNPDGSVRRELRLPEDVFDPESLSSYKGKPKLKMAGNGANPFGDLGAIGIGFAVGSVSEGGSSISFGANQSSNLATDAELGLTGYGVQFLQLRRMVIVPIHCGGEAAFYSGQGNPLPASPVPIATDSALGAVRVKPGSGLKVDEDGSLSLDTGTGG